MQYQLKYQITLQTDLCVPCCFFRQVIYTEAQRDFKLYLENATAKANNQITLKIGLKSMFRFVEFELNWISIDFVTK